MADSIYSKPFDEGAPLDPNSLNLLRTDILNTMALANSAYNQYKSGQNQSYKFIFDCGSFPLQTSIGRSALIPIPLGQQFEVGASIIVNASIGYASGAPETKEYTIPYISYSNSSNPQLYVVSTHAKSVIVFWTAVQKVQVTS